ncbi:MAG TPA: methylmalonyl-CoA mutase [Bacteroidetes bacterium]|nr:methylmalonyl-CoA mutase [Bacteroidota bacterium]HEX05422.1 methylmalonyl-CoA mutase [Bacteroidota bacterium]
MSQAEKDQCLLGDFTPPTLEEWREEVIRLLRGVPFEKKMLTRLDEGITLRGMYTRTDFDATAAMSPMPGDAPFTRGTRTTGHRSGWQVAQSLPYPTYEQLNRALLHDLERGQTTINLILDQATQLGMDPDHAEVGQVGLGGTSISSLIGLSKALDGVDLEKTVLHVEAGVAALSMAALVIALMRERNNDVSKWRGSAGMDPLAGLLEHGKLPITLKWAYQELAILTRWAADNAPHLKTICVYGHPYRNAGADAVTELAAAMATGVEALRQMEACGISVEMAANRMLFGFTTGPDFFVEIAKLRAARILWTRIVKVSGGSESAAQAMHMHVRTSSYRQSTVDPHSNMLRSTSEAFAAVLGGCDSLHITPYDAALTQIPSELARRIARNTQIILSEESHAASVIDPAGGSYYIETLTEELAEAAWAKFQKIEASGGMLDVLLDGGFHDEIAAQNDERKRKLGTRNNVLVGVNRYPNPAEKLAKPQPLPLVEIHRKRAEQLQRLRTSASHKQEMKVLEKLQGIITSHMDVKFEAVVEAATHGATIGEFTSSLRHEQSRSVEIEPLPTIRAAEEFERLRRTVASAQETATIFFACIGPFAQYMPRLDFIRSFYEVAGFIIKADEWYETAEAAVEAAKECGAKLVVIVGPDSVYDETVPTIAGAFAKDEKVIVHLAGYPKDKIEDYRAAGVDEFIHVKSNALTTLTTLASKMGVQS